MLIESKSCEVCVFVCVCVFVPSTGTRNCVVKECIAKINELINFFFYGLDNNFGFGKKIGFVRKRLVPQEKNSVLANQPTVHRRRVGIGRVCDCGGGDW